MFNSRQDQYEYRPQFGGFSFFPPVLKTVIILNVAVFFLQKIFEGNTLVVNDEVVYHWFERMFYLMPLEHGFKIWQLFTYMFLHGGFYHIFLNMLMLWMFGVEVENTWGSRKFLAFYLSCGVAAGLANLYIAPMLTDAVGPTIGASGSVYGVLVAFAMLFPNRYVYIYFLLPVKAKYMISFFILLELWQGIGSSDNIAHIAHLGGAVLAAIWVILDSRGVIDKMLSSRARLRPYSGPRQSNKTFSSTPKVQDAEFTDVKYRTPRSSGDSEFDAYQKAIDEILDKISKYGYAGLTENEKQILLDASRKIHPDKH